MQRLTFLTRYLFAKKKPVDLSELNPLQALSMARTHATATFNESIDLCLQLNVDPKHGDQMVRGTCNLPHSLGKKTSIAVLTDDEHKDLAKEADVLVGAAEIQQMKEGKFAFTKLICTQESMPLLKPLAKILGPKGLMPNAKVGTLIKASELEKTIAEAKKGQVTYRVDMGRNIHASMGKINMEDKYILENMHTFLQHLSEKKPNSVKGPFFDVAFLSSTMGPSFKIKTQTVDPKDKAYAFKNYI